MARVDVLSWSSGVPAMLENGESNIDRGSKLSKHSVLVYGAMRRLAALGASGLIALVALLAVAPASASAATCTAGTGPYQKQVEAYLGLPVDGRNSYSDCLAIQAWQSRNDIVPAAGYAGPLTNMVVSHKILARSRASMCPALSRVVCIDLTSQMMWIAESGKRVWGPYAIRSGRDGYETRTTYNRGGNCRSKYSTGSADYCTVFWKDRDHYNATGDHMPYSMFFDGGEALHTYKERYIYDPLGSHGCVHMLPSKAQWLWDHIPYGTKISVFGRKPGT
ncbi:MAG: L,D-transpeptidase [Propionibacteriaceae bacterium]|nr:L,D-transpeptidase [Propionibacteriaceae bacterium]